VVVALDELAQVSLRLQVHFFVTGIVFEAQLVVVIVTAAFGAARSNAALGSMLIQGVGRLIVVVVDAADHDGLVWIAIHEVDEHFLPDARDELKAEVRAGPRLGDTHPARAVFVVLVFLVPVELHPDAPVLLGTDLTVLGPDHDRRLGPRDHGPLRSARRPEGDAGLDRMDTAMHLKRCARRSRLELTRLNGEFRADDTIVVVEGLARMLTELEERAWSQPAHIARALEADFARPELPSVPK
jgi:hypothetical protein